MKKPQSQITRKEALTKMGKYAALTAGATFMILNPSVAQVQSQGRNTPNPNQPTDPGSQGKKR